MLVGEADWNLLNAFLFLSVLEGGVVDRELVRASIRAVITQVLSVVWTEEWAPELLTFGRGSQGTCQQGRCENLLHFET